MDKHIQTEISIPSLTLWKALIFNAIPTLLMIFGVYILMPALEKRGVSAYMSLLIVSSGVFTILFVASLVGYRQEGQPS